MPDAEHDIPDDAMTDLASLATAELPEHLATRAHVVRDRPFARNGEFVLVWLHHAVRAEENPALDIAAHLGAQLNLPVLVYQGLAGAHRFNSDRHHTFIMEGAADLQRALADDDRFSYAFFLGDRAQPKSRLPGLAKRAAAVVTEDFPAPPFPRWTERLAERTDAPVLAIDCACIVPMRLLGKRFGRAFKFRDAAKKEYAARVGRPWPACDASPPARTIDIDAPTITFERDAEALREQIANLCARCAIDHSIPPVRETPGGSAAGYARWSRFRDEHLRGYAKRRNNAALRDGVSRISPYLHHGHVSALRLAREAHAEGGDGPEKYLDELFVWREMAHNFCAYTPSEDLETSAALPDWAVSTLRAHAGDERDRVLTWETLARAQTGDELWDAAQRSLLRHGELHNNVRMTWGKALLGWTPGPGRALHELIDLNHRFALDGNDANSYGGLLWCLGQFDRPFKPEQPIIGTVRPRDTQTHRKRLDVQRYRAITDRAGGPGALRVAVVGGGAAGLFCGRALADQGLDVRVFDKGRGPGGRMSTRFDGEHRFDHGAQYFTLRDPRLGPYAESWRRAGVIDVWTPREARIDAHGNVEEVKRDDDPAHAKHVGTPGMHGLCAHLAETSDAEVSFGTRVTSVQREDGGWLVRAGDDDLGVFDVVLVALPGPQAAELLRGVHDAMAEHALSARLEPNWTLMLAMPDRLEPGFDAAKLDGHAAAWIARDSSKPSRPDDGIDRWVVQASPDWSRTHLELDRADARDRLLEAVRTVPGFGGIDPIFAAAHRWRYALAAEPVGEACVFDAEAKLGMLGDWLLAPRVEAALLSGMAAAGRVLNLPRDDAHAVGNGERADLFAQADEA